MKMMDLMMVNQCKVWDEIFRKTGTEYDEFEVVLFYYSQKDQEFALAFQEYMKKIEGSGVKNL